MENTFEFLLLVFHLLVTLRQERERRATTKGKEDAVESGKGTKKEKRVREDTRGGRVKEAS